MKIRINYENVRRRAEEISNVIQVLNARKLDLINTSNSLHSVWQGEAANTFKAKLDELIKELDSSIKEMAAILRDILQVVETIRREDERLAEEIGGIGSSSGFTGGAGEGGGGGGGGGR